MPRNVSSAGTVVSRLFPQGAVLAPICERAVAAGEMRAAETPVRPGPLCAPPAVGGRSNCPIQVPRGRCCIKRTPAGRSFRLALTASLVCDELLSSDLVLPSFSFFPGHRTGGPLPLSAPLRVRAVERSVLLFHLPHSTGLVWLCDVSSDGADENENRLLPRASPGAGSEKSPFLDQFDLNFSFTPCVKSPKGPGTRGLGFCWVLWRSGIGRLRQVQSPLWYRQACSGPGL